MRFAGTGRRGVRRESVVPMVNVAFLLLVFFLISARLEGPAPVAVRIPEADGQAAGAGVALWIDAGGTLHGPVAAAALADGGRVLLHADAGLPGARLAEVLSDLARAGIAEVRLVTVPR